jgi:hypothetical protein
LVVLILGSCFVGAQCESVQAVVASSSARAYKSASKSALSVSVKKGMKVKVTAVNGSWAKVSANGRTAYMPKSSLKVSGSNSSSKSSAKKMYVSKSTSVYKSVGSSTKKSVGVNTAVYVVGTSGSYYKVRSSSSGGATGYIKKSCVSSSKVSTNNMSWKSKVVKMDWFGKGQTVLKKGSYGTIYDIKSKSAIKIKRMGGHNHADVEPATASDTAKLLKACNGKWSWDSRSVILSASGNYVACAINTMPHGDQTIHNNNYDGQFCLHMVGSRTHGSDSVNPNHQRAIDKAYNWAH